MQTGTKHVSVEAARQMEAHKRYREEQARLEGKPPVQPEGAPKEAVEVIGVGGVKLSIRA